MPYAQWGDDLEPGAIAQMNAARALPVAVACAMMPDAHQGYGLPIGGVLATEGCVIPYAVGVDIACRMKLSVLDLPEDRLEVDRPRLRAVIERCTRFGVGSEFPKPHAHPVMDMDWSVSPITARNKDRAWRQLGTSGSGNHFVEIGVLTVMEDLRGTKPQEAVGGSHAALALAPGRYLAVLSHSGSRGTGAAVCDHYSKLAMERRRDLPKDQRYLAWLELSTQEGREYFAAMNLMGAYASANHAVIHRELARALSCEVLGEVENHHNFAWEETHVVDGRERGLVVHRKGATPAGRGVLGVIPGTMATPGFVVRGKGAPESLHSASHGAGRVMSRTKARERFDIRHARRALEALGVEVLSAGSDEVPGVYKDIHAVMAAQQDLVEILARFDPRIVKMAPEGERAED